ncbi:MAG: phosphatase PAP2 family protein [Bacteroidetes bacterium]|nr:MAG: phosphatase PAP2 family protein [Bacteroidota bacterium]
METLLHWDESLFILLNNGLENAFFDAVMPWLRNKYVWLPLYLFLGSFLVINYQKRGAYILLGLLLSVAVSDLVSSHIVKKTIERPRPCREVGLRQEVHLLVPCGGGYSFTSSHASNHFAVAVFLILTLGRVFKWIKLPLALWAASISFAQIYVGVHYPLDVIGGAVLGTVSAMVVYYGFTRILEESLE